MLFEDENVSGDASTEEAGEQGGQVEQKSTSGELTIEALNSEYKDSKMFENLKEKSGSGLLNEMAKQIEGLQRLDGQKIRIPGKDAGEDVQTEFFDKLTKVDGVFRLPTNDEERNSLLTKLGKPEASTGYDGGDLDLSAISGADLDAYKALAHSADLTNKQFQMLVAAQAAGVKDEQLNSDTNKEERIKQTSEVLKREWADGFDTRLKGAKLAINHAEAKFGKEAIDRLKSIGGDAEEVVIWALSEAAQNIKEDGDILSSAKPKYTETTQEIRSQIEEITSNPSYQKGDAVLAKKRRALYERLGQLS